MGCHFLLQGIFPAQGSNPGYLHCRQTVYQLIHQGSPCGFVSGVKTWQQTEVLVELSVYKQSIPIGKVNYSQYVTNSKIIKLFPSQKGMLVICILRIAVSFKIFFPLNVLGIRQPVNMKEVAFINNIRQALYSPSRCSQISAPPSTGAPVSSPGSLLGAPSWYLRVAQFFRPCLWEVWVGGSCLPATWSRQVFVASAAGTLTDSALMLPPNAFEVLLPPKPQVFWENSGLNDFLPNFVMTFVLCTPNSIT